MKGYFVVLKFIKKSVFFSGYSDAEIEQVYRLAKEQSFTAGQKIIEAGKPNDNIWILIEGNAVVQDYLPGGLEVELHKLQAGELFGEYSFVDYVPASANVVAKDLVRVLRIPFEGLREFFTKNPKCELISYRELARVMSQRLRKANNEIKKSLLNSLGWDHYMQQAADTASSASGDNG